MKHNTIVNTFRIAAITALALGMAPMTKAADKGCSNATLKGAFVHSGTGFITAPPAQAGPFAHVSVQTFDGKGVLTSTGFVSVNGNIIPTTETGTYTVNPDCTGTGTLFVSPIGLTSRVFFVIDDGGNGLQVISTDPGLVVTGFSRRQFPLGDLRN